MSKNREIWFVVLAVIFLLCACVGCLKLATTSDGPSPNTEIPLKEST